MENNKGCLIYLAVSLVLTFVIYKIQETTFFDAFLDSLTVIIGLTVIFAIIKIIFENSLETINNIKEQCWDIVKTDTFKNLVQFGWYFIAFYVYSKSNEYEKLGKIVEICNIIFIFIFPVLLFSFFDSLKLRKLEEKQKDYDDLKEQCEYYKELLLQHKIIRYGNDDD